MIFFVCRKTLDQTFETNCLIKTPFLSSSCLQRLHMANMSLKSFESAVMLMLLFSFLICCYYFGFLTSNPTTGFIQNICMYAFCFFCKCRWRFTRVSLLLSSHFYIFLFVLISLLFMCLMSYQSFPLKYEFSHISYVLQDVRWTSLYAM